MKVADCLNSLECPEEDLGTHEDGPIAARLLSAANNAIEAALALGYASELAASAERRSEANEEIMEEIEERQRRFSEDLKRKAAAAGALGARAKNARYEILKIWALEKAGTMNGDDKSIARKLSRELPSHLVDVSGDPVRLIYDALRARRKPN
jgi:hypothetical protein